jgi:hypothetical protein
MITQALKNLRPTSSFSVVDELYENIVWLSDDVKPTKEEVQLEVARLQAEYDYKEYQRLRKPEYPSMQEQLDMQYWDAVNGTTTWQDAINAVKAKYPKPTES